MNVTPDLPNVFETAERDINYLKIPIADHWSQNLATHFPQAIRFIGKWIYLLLINVKLIQMVFLKELWDPVRISAIRESLIIVWWGGLIIYSEWLSRTEIYWQFQRETSSWSLSKLEKTDSDTRSQQIKRETPSGNLAN